MFQDQGVSSRHDGKKETVPLATLPLHRLSWPIFQPSAQILWSFLNRFHMMPAFKRAHARTLSPIFRDSSLLDRRQVRQSCLRWPRSSYCSNSEHMGLLVGGLHQVPVLHAVANVTSV